MVDLGQQLRVERQTAEERRAGLGNEAHGKLTLEHEHGAAEQRAVRQKFEGQRRRDLIGNVGHAHVEVGQLNLQEIAVDDLQLVSVFTAARAWQQHRNSSSVVDRSHR